MPFAFIFLSCFDALARMMSKRLGESRSSWLFLILGGNNYIIYFFTIKYNVNYSFLKIPFIELKKFPIIASLPRVIIMNTFKILLDVFLCIFSDDQIFSFFLFFYTVGMLKNIDWLKNVEPSLHFQEKAYLAMMFYYFYKVLELI